ncbi:MAG: aminoacyl-histidine dipeptidase [Lachnospiraceae bacterium]|nr:aminoacyl-histidine dipeptidase [Lachnospiraceae bacterium]
MGALTGLEPERVFFYFEEITKIPHGSGNVDAISDYLKAFAAERGLFVLQDEMKNIIIKKPASAGYEGQAPMILQGHMDMVAVQEAGRNIDMKTQPLEVFAEGDLIGARGTSLGGDDGIAVAYALALLESDTIPHPPLEVIITTEEEVGMDGARAIDLSCLEGHRLLNLDSEDEGIFLAGCAGGARVACLVPLGEVPAKGTLVTFRIGGLLGGHSGSEIDKGRANANILAGRLLYETSKAAPDLGLVSIAGGMADNAIPQQTCLSVSVPREQQAACLEAAKRFAEQVAAEYRTPDPGFVLETECGEGATDAEGPAYRASDAARFLLALPNGIQAMSADVPGLVETSLNLGILKLLEGGTLHAEFSVRSSVESARDALIAKLQAVTELAGGRNEITGVYPGWKYRTDSPLREKMIRVFERLYGKTPKVEAIHAGLECGLLAGKIPDLDCVSIGPDMKDIHTAKERLSISSVRRVWEFVLALLAEKDA